MPSSLAEDISALYSGPFTALGSELLSGVVSLLYEKLFQHEETRRFFEGKDRKKIQRHMAGFLSCALSRSGNPALSPKQVWFFHRHMLRGYQPLAPKKRDRAAEPANKRTHAAQCRPPQRHASLPELEFLGAVREPDCAQQRAACPVGGHGLQVEPRSASELSACTRAAAADAVGKPFLAGLCTALSDEHHCAALFSRDSCSSSGSATAGGSPDAVTAGSPDSCSADSCSPAAAKSGSTQSEGASQCPEVSLRMGYKHKPSVSYSGECCPLSLSSSVFGGTAEEGAQSRDSSTADSCPFTAKHAASHSESAHEGPKECPYPGFKQRPSVSFSGESCPMASSVFEGVREEPVREEQVLRPHHAHVMMILLRDTLAELGAEHELTESMSAFVAQSSHVFERGDFFYDPEGREAEWQRVELEKKVRQQPVAKKVGMEGTRSKSFNSRSTSGSLPKLSRMGNMCMSRSALSCTNLNLSQVQALEEQEKAEKVKEDMRAIFSSW